MIDPDKLSPDQASRYWRECAKTSAERMVKLLDLNAPNPILENELTVLTKRIAHIVKARKRHN